MTNPTQPTDVNALARECAEKIVKLTGFGHALHVNDIAPDIAATFRPVVEERDEALKQQKYAWQRHAEKDRAYGEALAERDQLRAEVERVKQLGLDGIDREEALRDEIKSLKQNG